MRHARRLASLLGLVMSSAPALPAGAEESVARSYRFLVMPVERGGMLYTATAGALARKRLPLSFIDDADYWGTIHTPLFLNIFCHTSFVPASR